jgi:hypothetical protein
MPTLVDSWLSPVTGRLAEFSGRTAPFSKGKINLYQWSEYDEIL